MGRPYYCNFNLTNQYSIRIATVYEMIQRTQDQRYACQEDNIIIRTLNRVDRIRIDCASATKTRKHEHAIAAVLIKPKDIYYLLVDFLRNHVIALSHSSV